MGVPQVTIGFQHSWSNDLDLGTPMTSETPMEHHEKSIESQVCSAMKILPSLHCLKSITPADFVRPCWMRLFHSARPSSQHHQISKSSPRSFFVFSASSRAWRPSSPPQPRLSRSTLRPRFCSNPAAKAKAPAAPMLFRSR